MEGLALVDYGSDQDDAVVPGADAADAQQATLGSQAAAAAVDELKHVEPSAPIPIEVNDTIAGRAASVSSGDDGRTTSNLAGSYLDLDIIPPGKVAIPLQEAVDKYLKMRRDYGVEVKAVINLSRAFRNPYFLQKWVHDANISEEGSSMPPHCFDPSSLPEEDFYDNLQKAWETKKGRQKERQKVSNSGKQGSIQGGVQSTLWAQAQAKAD